MSRDGRDASLARYLRAGPDQRRLVEEMASGHAHRRHGAELGRLTTTQFKSQVTNHLRSARTAYAVETPDGHRSYLVADPAQNRVAWIPPHKEHRATFFAPDDGVADYVSTKQRLARGVRWRSIEPGRLRDAGRSGGRGIDPPGPSPHGPDLGR
jgi:hypothetical protein